jgi:hypothetical protein
VFGRAGKVSKAGKKKEKEVGGGQGENKVPQNKTEVRGKKKNWEGGREKVKLKKKLRSGLRKGKEKK